jgi:hypothetical protein
LHRLIVIGPREHCHHQKLYRYTGAVWSIPPYPPHIRSITFHSISVTREVRKWFRRPPSNSDFSSEDEVGVEIKGSTPLDVEDVRFIDCDKEGEVSKTVP